MADEIFLLDSPAIEAALAGRETVTTRRRRFGKSSLNEIPEVSGGSSEYNGYFKIIAVPFVDAEGQPTGQFEVHIFDGARDGYTGNYLKVNGKFKSVSAYKSEPLSNGGYTFYIQFNPGDETVAILRKDLVISSWVDLPSVENSEIIGEVVVKDGVAQVRQRAFGMIHLIAFAPCGVSEE